MGAVERRFEITKLLCRERHMTMSALADIFSVSIRTIKRDIDEIGYMIPLLTKPGRHDGGVYVMDGYKWDRVYMSFEDIELLKKIKSIGEKGEKLILDEFALERISKIISRYSLPEKK